MRQATATAGDGACYKRRNDDKASSFRKCDKANSNGGGESVKSSFNRLNSASGKVRE